MTTDRKECPPDVAAEGEGHGVPADPRLLAQGWVRRHLAEPARAQEAIELYASLGFEVKAQTLSPADLGPHCGDCAQTICASYVLIYTRERPS